MVELYVGCSIHSYATKRFGGSNSFTYICGIEKFYYIVVTADNAWEGQGKQATQDEIDQDVADIQERVGKDVELIIFKATSMISYGG